MTDSQNYPSATDNAPTAMPKPVIPVLSYARPHGLEPGIWRSGKFVVVNDAADLPYRCVRCNTPADDWILLHIPSRRTDLHVCLCQRHMGNWRFWQTIGMLFIVFGVPIVLLVGMAMCSAIASYWSQLSISDLFGELSGVAFLAAIFFLPATVIDRRFTPLGRMKRAGNTLWLWPSGRAFRNSFRELEGPNEPPQTPGNT